MRPTPACSSLHQVTHPKQQAVRQRSSRGAVAENDASGAPSSRPHAALVTFAVATDTPATLSDERHGTAQHDPERPVAAYEFRQTSGSNVDGPLAASQTGSPSLLARQVHLTAVAENSNFLTASHATALSSRPRSLSLPEAVLREDVRRVGDRRFSGVGSEREEDGEREGEQAGPNTLARQVHQTAAAENSKFLTASHGLALTSRPRSLSLPEAFLVKDVRRASEGQVSEAGSKSGEVGKGRGKQVVSNTVDGLQQQSVVRKRRLSSGTAPPAKAYRCEQCAQSFTRSYNLKSHALIHSNEKPFTCDVCDMAFSRQHDLRRHAKLHTGEKPYKCRHCDRAFARLDALSRHMRAEDVKSCRSDASLCGSPCGHQYSFTSHATKQHNAAAEGGNQVLEESRTAVGVSLKGFGDILCVPLIPMERTGSPPRDSPRPPNALSPKQAYYPETSPQHEHERQRQEMNSTVGSPTARVLRWVSSTYPYDAAVRDQALDHQPLPPPPPQQQQHWSLGVPALAEYSQQTRIYEGQQEAARLNGASGCVCKYALSGGSQAQDEGTAQAILELTTERDQIAKRVAFLEEQLAVERDARERLRALEDQVQHLEIEKRLLQSMVMGQGHALPVPHTELPQYPVAGATPYDPGAARSSVQPCSPQSLLQQRPAGLGWPPTSAASLPSTTSQATCLPIAPTQKFPSNPDTACSAPVRIPPRQLPELPARRPQADVFYRNREWTTEAHHRQYQQHTAVPTSSTELPALRATAQLINTPSTSLPAI